MTDNPWIEWKGGECPVDRHTVVDVEFRDGTIWTYHRAGKLCASDENENYWVWEPSSPEDDIIAYRLSGPSA